MNLIYFFHGEHLVAFYLTFYALVVVGWCAIVYALIKFWQSRKK